MKADRVFGRNSSLRIDRGAVKMLPLQSAALSLGAPAMDFEFKLPAHPQTLIRLSAMLGRAELNLSEVGDLIAADLALAAAVMKTASSPLYGLKGRVQSVQQAVTYLGVREIAAISYESGLRDAFPQVPALLALWERARMRGALMGRIAQALSMEAWSAHTAGLFEECGKALLYAAAPTIYGPLLAAAGDDDLTLVEREQQDLGTNHAEVGARLCESWGLPVATVNCVRHHVATQSTWRLPPVSHRYVCVLSALAHVLTRSPDRLDEAVGRIAPQAMMDQGTLLRAMQKVSDKIEDALADA
jgi:HD-like signal output (HDOD) protein